MQPAGAVACRARGAATARHAGTAYRAGVAVAALSLLLAACGPSPDALVEHRLLAMATWVDLTLPARATLEHPALIAEIESELAAFGNDYYAWGDGELARLNRALGATGRFEASPAMAALLERAAEVAAASDGAFDPGVGALVELYGFNDATRPPVAPPDGTALAATLAAFGSIRNLDVDGTALAAPPGRYAFDLGGIAKGAAVDRVVERLTALAIAPALVNAGGDLRVLGSRPDRPWRIGIQDPRGDGLLGTLALGPGEAAFSSGDYERFVDRDGERLHHIIDPRTGTPAAHTRAVTVIAGDGVTADAAATALFVAGPADWRRVAARLGIVLALRVDAAGTLEMTPAMRDRFEPGPGAGAAIIRADP